jgi:hypothetical protein
MDTIFLVNSQKGDRGGYWLYFCAHLARFDVLRLSFFREQYYYAGGLWYVFYTSRVQLTVNRRVVDHPL